MERDEQILRSLVSIKGQDWVDWFMETAYYYGSSGNYRVIKNLREEHFEEEQIECFGAFGKAFIDQDDPGEGGDTFYGSVYFKLNSKQRYLKFDYIC
ncbi:hypothetical protein [Leptospira noguchii]|uniref:hypothetical protein n=1 Tax=Leptospira noguchii TaxID=28182 RepID=UPI000328523A|nr:hypothetical protein [Leptospira noguchii]EMS84088.1 hypothetical protein LEP1GSC073_2736 [Leptospira noguchii str. Cascata]